MLKGTTLTLGVALIASPALAAASRWDGADDLPVNPLACGARPAARGSGQALRRRQADQRRPT